MRRDGPDNLRDEALRSQRELLQTQIYLEASRDRYADLYDFAPIGYLTLSANGLIQELNLTGSSLLGVERLRAIGAPLLVYIDSPDRFAFLRHLQWCRSGRMPVTTEITLRCREGRRTPVQMTSSGDAVAPQRFRTVLIDLTERKQAEAQLRASQARLRAMATELSLAEERERRRVATALHDNIGQVLALARIKLGSLRKKQVDNPDLPRVLELVDEAISQTRSLTLELSPPVLYTFGLDAALEWLAERMRGQGLAVEVRSDGRRRALSEDIRVFLFQAVRELLTNVVKHARATMARVLITTAAAGTEITVEDDGIGFAGPDEGAPAAAAPPRVKGPAGRRKGEPTVTPESVEHSATAEGAYGLFNLRNRLQYLGGRIDFEPRHDGGTRVTLVVPARAPNGAAVGAVAADANAALAAGTGPMAAGREDVARQTQNVTAARHALSRGRPAGPEQTDTGSNP